MLAGEARIAFGLTEPMHGSDATWMETTAYRDGDEWVINGEKRWNTGMHVATHDYVFARTSGKPGDAAGITAFLVPADTPGFKVEFMWWTFNMPTDHAEVTLTDVRVPDSDACSARRAGAWRLAQFFVHENRIRQAASGARRGAVLHRRGGQVRAERKPFGKPLSVNQAIQWPLVELHTEAEMLRELIRKTAWEMDQIDDAHRDQRQGGDVQLPGEPAGRARPPTGPSRSMAASATAATCRSSTSTAITAAIASPRAPRRSRCARSASTCSASAGDERNRRIRSVRSSLSRVVGRR